MRRVACAGMFVMIIGAGSARAQWDSSRTAVRGDMPPFGMSADTSMRNAFLALNRSVNTFLWTISSNAAGRAAAGTYALSERVTASMIPEMRQAAAERTDAMLALALAYPVGQLWSVDAVSSWQSTADNRNIGINNVSRVGAMAGLSGRIGDVLQVIGRGGGVTDRQIGLRDAGAQYYAALNLLPVEVTESGASGRGESTVSTYTFWGRAASAQEFLSPRHNTTHSGEFNASLGSRGTDVRAHVDIIHTERDFYFSDSSSTPYTGKAYNIEQRFETGLHGSLLGEYVMSEQWRLRFDGDVTDRTVTRGDAYKSFQLPGAHIDTRVDELRLAGSTALLGELYGAAVSVNIRYEEFQETHGVVPAPENTAIVLQQQASVEAQKNSIARRFQLGGALGIPLNNVDSVQLTASLGILHYDTPDTVNTDDRDELDMAFHAAYATHPFPGCAWGVRADMFLHHLVYLFSAQSGNNAWNRIIRLSPFVTLTPANRFRTIASFEVLGNYTVFDFESILQSVHSYSYRQLELRDSSEYDLLSTLRLTGFADLRWYEHGQLVYSTFRERPIDRVEEWTYGVSVQQALSTALRVNTGVRSFTRYVSTYRGNNVYAPSTSLRAIGPTVLLSWIAAGYGVLSIDGWYEVIHEGELPARTVPNVMMSVQWTL